MKWFLEKRKISELHEYAKNPRILKKNDAEHLQKSLSKFGQCEPIVINIDGTIIGGHQRLRTMRKLKYKEVDVYVPNTALTDKEVEELNIRLNKNTGDFDFDILANAWELDDLIDWGFKPEDFDLDLEQDSGADPEGEEAPPTIIKIEVGNEELASFENQLDMLLIKFATAKRKK